MASSSYPVIGSNDKMNTEVLSELLLVSSSNEADDSIAVSMDRGAENNTITSDADKQLPLDPAFEVFSDLSMQLTESYQLLEDRVEDLTAELSSVSEQREQELKQKEQFAKRLENLVNFLPGGVVVLDQRGVVVDTNPAAQKMLTTSLLDKPINGALWREVIQKCFAPREDDGHEVSTHQGQRISITTRSLGEDGQIILLTDQTETRRLQSELSRHERLTALGKMVSTLAHQVRTPLSSAMLYGNHLLNESLHGEQQKKFTQKLVNRLHEMERQVSDMLLFVKGDLPLNDSITIETLQQHLSETIEMSLEHNEIECSWKVDAADEYIYCNCDALVGAILNLINNSSQAMPEGGCIHISFTKQGQNTLVISVDDEGEGICPNIQGKVNELFYTTKPQGTGIGLSVVNTVAQSHGGNFSLSSNMKGGVCAMLSLPIIGVI